MEYTTEQFESDLGFMAGPKTKVKHPGILDVPEGFMKEKGIKEIANRMFNRAKAIGRSPVMRGLMNLVRWNINQDKTFSNKMRSVIENLKARPSWQEIPGVKTSHIGLMSVNKLIKKLEKIQEDIGTAIDFYHADNTQPAAEILYDTYEIFENLIDREI